MLPTGLALDNVTQVLYVSEAGAHRVRAIQLDPGTVYPASSATISGPEHLPWCPNVTVPTNPLLLGRKFCNGSTGTGPVMYVNPTADSLTFEVTATQAGSHELQFRYADRYQEVSVYGGRRLRLFVNDVSMDDVNNL